MLLQNRVDIGTSKMVVGSWDNGWTSKGWRTSLSSFFIIQKMLEASSLDASSLEASSLEASSVEASSLEARSMVTTSF